VTLSKGTTGMKKKAPGSQAEKQKRGTCSNGNNVLLAVAAAANMACPGAQVRKEPAPQECPAGAIETMRSKLDLDVGDKQGNAEIPRYIEDNNQPIPVREGPITMELVGPWGKLPDETVLSGQLFIGEKRVHGRITQAVTPAGDTFTVCMELQDVLGGPGLVIESDSEQTIKVRRRVELRTVDRFK
jgi:serine/threonine-protein kinase